MTTLEGLLGAVRCPQCGRENTYTAQDVDIAAQVNGDMIHVTVKAGVCANCGERLFDSTATSAISKAMSREMPCPVCGAPMPDLKGGKASICPVCGFKDSCCF